MFVTFLNHIQAQNRSNKKQLDFNN